MSNRRNFLKCTSILTGAALLNRPMASLASIGKKINSISNLNNTLIIFHTNDLHGKLDRSFKNEGSLSSLQKIISNEDSSGLLVDAGDFLNAGQGRQKDENVIRAMNDMGYHVATIGNQDLSGGEEYLAGLTGLMNFDLVNCNYLFSNLTLKKRIKDYSIISFGQIKVGITGVGPEINQAGITSTNPYLAAEKVAKYLKEAENCHFVICLSHLGINKTHTFTSQGLATTSENIDCIVSGHGKQIMTGAKVYKNRTGKDIFVSQAGFDAKILGKTTIRFNSDFEPCGFDHNYRIAGLPVVGHGNEKHKTLISLKKITAVA